MRSIGAWLVFVGAIGGAASDVVGNQAGPQTQKPATAEAGNAANGKAIFMAHQCWACHGYNGETGTRLLREDGTFIPRLQTQSGFINFIRAPRPNEAPPIGSSITMPSYGVASLPDQQAADLWAYIRTFKPTQPPVKDIPLLEQMLKEGGKLKGQP
jgi:mono/diheme cytochrome c family protein